MGSRSLIPYIFLLKACVCRLPLSKGYLNINPILLEIFTYFAAWQRSIPFLWNAPAGHADPKRNIRPILSKHHVGGGEQNDQTRKRAPLERAGLKKTADNSLARTPSAFENHAPRARQNAAIEGTCVLATGAEAGSGGRRCRCCFAAQKPLRRIHDPLPPSCAVLPGQRAPHRTPHPSPGPICFSKLDYSAPTRRASVPKRWHLSVFGKI